MLLLTYAWIKLPFFVTSKFSRFCISEIPNLSWMRPHSRYDTFIFLKIFYLIDCPFKIKYLTLVVTMDQSNDNITKIVCCLHRGRPQVENLWLYNIILWVVCTSSRVMGDFSVITYNKYEASTDIFYIQSTAMGFSPSICEVYVKFKACHHPLIIVYTRSCVYFSQYTNMGQGILISSVFKSTSICSGCNTW